MTHTTIANGATGLAVRTILNNELGELLGQEKYDYVSVADTTARDALPAEYLVAGKKVYVTDIDTVYIYNGATWDEEQIYLSAGALENPSYTSTVGVDGNITVAALDVALYSETDFSGRIHSYSLPETVLAMTDGSTNYVIANYNSGTPAIQVTTNVNLINESTVVPLFSLYRNGTTLHEVNWDSLGDGLSNKLHQSIVKTQRYRRESGLSLSEYGTRNIALTSGVVWIGANSVSLASIASATDNITFYKHVAGVWTASTITAYNNTQYDDGTDLVTLSAASRYAVNWIYRGVESAKHLYLVLGSGDYTETQALASNPPTPPSAISTHATLVGRIIVQESASTAYAIQSAFDTQFSIASTLSHSDLTNRDVAGNHAKMIPATDGANALQWTKADGTTARVSLNTSTGQIDIGDIAGGNYTDFEDDGTVVFNGNATVYKDLIMPAVNLRPGLTSPTFAAFTDGIYGYRFDAGSADELHGAVELQHDYKEGTDLVFHVHWSPTTTNTGNIVWGIDYSIANPNTTFGTAVNVAATPTAAPGIINRHVLENIVTISGSGLKIGAIVTFRVYRQNGGTDTFTGNAFLHSIGIHYICDTVGSRQITTK